MTDINQALYDRLFLAFQSNSETGIFESEHALFYPNYPDFMSFLKDFASKQSRSMCPASWKNSVCGQCVDCQRSESSCLCLPCFLAGHHEEHNSHITFLNGTCDCGDPLYWKPEGNCPHHQSCVKHPEIEYLNEDERKTFLTIFLAALNGTVKFTPASDSSPGKYLPIIPVITWLLRFIDCADSLRRLLAIAVCRVSDEDMTKTILRLNKDESSLFIQFIVRLVSDRYFRSHFSLYVYRHFNEFNSLLFEQLREDVPNFEVSPYCGVAELFNNIFHFFNKYAIKSALKHQVSIFDVLIKYLDDLVDIVSSHSQSFANCDWVRLLEYFDDGFEYLVEIQDYNAINSFIEKLTPILIKMERLLPYYTRSQPEDDNEESGQLLSCILMNSLHVIFKILVCTKLNLKPVFDALVTLYSIDKIEGSNSKDSETVSLFKPYSRIRLSLPLTSLFYMMLIEYHEDMLHELKSNCQRCSISLDDFLIRTSVYLIRYFCFFRNIFHFTLFMSESTRDAVIFTLNQSNETYSRYFLYLQYVMCLVENKERFFKSIAASFGLFDEISQTDTFLHFVETLIVDRLLVRNDRLEIERNRMISTLTSTPKATSQQISSQSQLSDQIIVNELLSIADHINGKDGKSYFRLKKGVEFNYFFPLTFMPIVVESLSKNIDNFIHFSFNITDHFVDNLKIPTFSSTIIGVVFYSLINFNKSTSSAFALSTLKLFCQLNHFNMSEQLELTNPDLKEMMHKLTINNFLNAKVNDKTLIDYASQSEYGEQFLVCCNIGYQSTQKPEERNEANKLKARKIKQNLIDEFRELRNSFNSKQLPEGILEVEATNECPSCHENMDFDSNELIGYPAIVSPSVSAKVMQASIDGKKWMLGFPNEGIIDVVICNHPMHLNCKPTNRVYQCPLCKSLRILILPAIPKNISFDSTEVPSNLIQPMDDFVNSYFGDKYFGGLLNLIRTMDYEVHNHELRFRVKPDILDNPEFRIIISNLFRIVYFKSLISNDIAQNMVDDMRVPLIKFIHELVKSRNTNNFVCSNHSVNEAILKSLHITLDFFKNDLLYNQNDSDEVQANKRVKLFEFLRRALIFCYFGIREDSINLANVGKVIDWDSILTFPNLCKIFQIKPEQEIKPNEEIALKAFTSPPLSPRFISNFQEPYNYDIFDMEIPKYLDMMTGLVIPEPQFLQYASAAYQIASSMYLVLSGPISSTVIVMIPFLSKRLQQKGFYLDQFGDEDPGFRRGAITYLSTDRLEKAIDSFAASDFINLRYNE